MLHEVSGLNPLDLALLPQLTQLRHLSMVAPKSDTWLGLAPIRLLTKLRCLKQLEWIPCEKALSGLKSKAGQEQLDAFALFVTRGNSSSLVSPVSSLAVLTLPVALGKYERLAGVAEQLMKGGCQVKLLTPSYCEHSGCEGVRGSRVGRLLSGLGFRM